MRYLAALLCFVAYNCQARNVRRSSNYVATSKQHWRLDRKCYNVIDVAHTYNNNRRLELARNETGKNAIISSGGTRVIHRRRRALWNQFMESLTDIFFNLRREPSVVGEHSPPFMNTIMDNKNERFRKTLAMPSMGNDELYTFQNIKEVKPLRGFDNATLPPEKMKQFLAETERITDKFDQAENIESDILSKIITQKPDTDVKQMVADLHKNSRSEHDFLDKLLSFIPENERTIATQLLAKLATMRLTAADRDKKMLEELRKFVPDDEIRNYSATILDIREKNRLS